MYAHTPHQLKQIEVIDQIERQLQNRVTGFSTVSPIENFQTDPRTCLTSVHLPRLSLLEKIQSEIIKPLREIEPDFYYYSTNNLHITIKNIRVINDPPHFDNIDIDNAVDIFREAVPQHRKFNVFYYRLLLFPNNLALVGTTDEELDRIVLDLDQRMKIKGVPDDKVYVNQKYFFSNMTLARFRREPSDLFKRQLEELANCLPLNPYIIDTVTLLTSNAVLEDKKILGTWKLS